MTDAFKSLPDARQFCPTLTQRKLAEEDALLVDVREAAEVAATAFDVSAQVQLPMSELERRFSELPRDRLLVLASSTGTRSLKATYFLMYQGFTNVANLDGGLEKWARKGFSVRGGTPVPGAPGCCAGTPGAPSAEATAGGCCAPPRESATLSAGCC
ncbi:MAG: rhodanese-like domain-containing protein [Stenotrophomonas sp.]